MTAAARAGPLAVALVILALSGIRIIASPCKAAEPGPAPPPRILVIGTRAAPPFAMKSSTGEWEGIAIDLWRRAADELGIKFKFKEAPLEDLLSGVADGTFDAAIGALSATSEREKTLDFSQPFYSAGLGIAISVKGQSAVWTTIRALASLRLVEALAGIIGVVLLVAFVVWWIERSGSGEIRAETAAFLPRLFWSAATAAGFSHEATPRSVAGEIVSISWMFMSVLLTSSFTAFVTAQLTAAQLRQPTLGLADLRSRHVGTIADTEASRFLTRRRIAFSTFPGVHAGLLALDNGDIDAFVDDRPLLVWRIGQDFAGRLDVTSAQFDMQSYGIALPNGSPLRKPIDRAVLGILADDWWTRTVQGYLGPPVR